MVTSYFFAQLLPSIRGGNGSLLVLGSANVDECTCTCIDRLSKYGISTNNGRPTRVSHKVGFKRKFIPCKTRILSVIKVRLLKCRYQSDW